MGILTTGVSSSERARRQLLAKEILKLLQSKAKSGTQLKTQALLEMVQAQSQVVSYMHGELFVLKKIMPHFQLMTLWKTLLHREVSHLFQSFALQKLSNELLIERGGLVINWGGLVVGISYAPYCC